MKPRFRFLAMLAIVGLSYALVGCNGSTTTPGPGQSKAADEDHAQDEGHQHPETYPESVTELSEMFATIKEAFADGDFGTADGPIHEAPHLLGELPLLAGRLSLEEPQKEAIKAAIDTLSESLKKLDATVHEQEGGASWDDVGESIEEALKTLQAHAS